MDNTALLFLTESVLGKGQSTSKGNYAFKCPFCTHHKNKMEISMRTTEKKENFWHCWVCGAKGKTLLSLFKKIKAPAAKIAELNILVVPNKAHQQTEKGALELPKEFIAFDDHEKFITDRVAQIESKHALRFLRRRGITVDDITKYNIGFCKDGKYGGRVIIPSFDGIFDALTIKRNVIPLFGKVLHDKLMQKLVMSSVNRIYIALDQDARRDALKQAEKLMSYGKEVYMVELEGKDANEIGFEAFLNTIEQTQPLTFQSLLEKKLQLI